MAEASYKVTLNVYDLSQGLARQFSSTLLGKVIDGIWHTGIVVYGKEYFFGGGIQHCPVGRTPYGKPVRVMELGETHVPKELFEDYLREIGPRYTMETYNLFSHNCNNFSNEVSLFLVGTPIPDYILQLPNEVLNSPMSPLILPMIQQLETTLKVGAAPQAPQFKPATGSQPATTTTETRAAATGSHQSKPVENTEQSEPAKSDSSNGTKVDPLGSARNVVQEEIKREFQAIMASGALRASEAAALATRRVMERYGRLNNGIPQQS